MSGFLTRRGEGGGRQGGGSCAKLLGLVTVGVLLKESAARPPLSVRVEQHTYAVSSPWKSLALRTQAQAQAQATGHRTQEQGCKLEKEGVRRRIAFCCT